MQGLPLEPDRNLRRELGKEVLEFLDEWLDRRPTLPTTWPGPHDRVLDELLKEPQEHGVELRVLLEAVNQATETGFDTAGPGMLSYIPSGGLYTAAIGALIGSVTNRYTGGSHASPGMTAIEESVLRWMTGLFELPASASGVLTSGGSIANQIAVVTARSRFGDDFGDGVVYTSARAHHSIHKAARIAGISNQRVRLIEVDDELRMDTRALERQISLDLNQGLQPMMVAATAGTTDTGNIDPLDECAELAASTGAWFHVDAAYGGFFQLTERGRSRLGGIGRADSITVDAHKSLFLPFGVGGLLMRDRAAVMDAHEGFGAYMQDVVDGELPHYMEMGPEQTRPNRGIQVWLAANLHGVGRFRSELDRMLDLAERAAELLSSLEGIELLGKPHLSIVAFRSSEGDEATRAIFDTLIASRKVHVSSTTIDGYVYIRLAFLNQRTTHDVLDTVVDIVQSTRRNTA